MIRLLIWLVFGLLAATEVSAQELHLKSAAGRVERLAMAGGGGNQRHVLIQFDHPPNNADLRALARSGAKVVAAVPDNGVMVSMRGAVPGVGDLMTGVRWTGSLQVGEKLSKELDRNGWNSVVVEFHADVDSAEQDLVLGAEGLLLSRDVRLRTNHVLVSGSFADLAAVAAHDEVAYVFPADSVLAAPGQLYGCAGMMTQYGVIGQYSNIVHGWDLDSDLTAHLQYVFAETTPKLSALQVRAEVMRAMGDWARSASLVFTAGTNPTTAKTIAVRFFAGPHGDAFPFDGPGGVLAHTFYPVPVNAEPLAGDVHLDADENWHVGGDLDLYSVALHELGHAIGLGHSDVPGDVMYPYYRTGLKLTANDVGAAQQLYGPPAGQTPVGGGSPIPTNPTPTNPTPTNPAPTNPTPTNPVPPNPTPTNPVPPNPKPTNPPNPAPTNPAPAPSTPAPAITMKAPSTAVAVANVILSGTLTGGTTPVNIVWQTDNGSSGSANVLTGGLWVAANIPLRPGANTVTITATDAEDRIASQVAKITYSPATTESNSPISISVQSPAGTVVTTASTSMTVSGVSSGGNGGVKNVTWQTSSGSSGEAAGTGKWTTSAIPLLVGTNTLVIKAFDSSGASGWTTLVVVRH